MVGTGIRRGTVEIIEKKDARGGERWKGCRVGNGGNGRRKRKVVWKIEAETRQLLLQLWRRPERSQLSVAIVGECGSTQAYFRWRHAEVKAG